MDELAKYVTEIRNRFVTCVRIEDPAAAAKNAKWDQHMDRTIERL
jgi:hypothetical protein